MRVAPILMRSRAISSGAGASSFSANAPRLASVSTAPTHAVSCVPSARLLVRTPPPNAVSKSTSSAFPEIDPLCCASVPATPAPSVANVATGVATPLPDTLRVTGRASIATGPSAFAPGATVAATSSAAAPKRWPQWSASPCASTVKPGLRGSPVTVPRARSAPEKGSGTATPP